MSDAPLQRLDQIERAMAAAGIASGPYRDVLERWRRHLHRYAELEKALLGHVWVTVSMSLVDVTLPEDPLQAGEIVAEKERKRLGLGRGEAGDVMTLLDREGLKVYRPPFPAAGPVEGIFLFDPEVGPALVVDGSLSPREGDFVFARLYAHYLVDNDPYAIRFARRESGPGANREDLRARAFAAAFLISREGLDEYLRAMGRGETAPITPDAVRQLALYFEVGPRSLLTRLLSLGRITSSEVPELLRSLEAEPLFPPAPPDMPALGERFIRLALEAHAREMLDRETLARYLETNEETAAALASEFRLDGSGKGGGPAGAGEGEAAGEGEDRGPAGGDGTETSATGEGEEP